MSRTLSAAYTIEKNKAANRPIRLFAITGGSLGATVLRYAEWSEDVTYNAQTYTTFPIRVEELSENINAEIESMRVILSSVDRTIIAYLESYDGLRGSSVTIKTVFADLLGDATAYTDDLLYIASCATTENEATFILKSKLDIMGVEIPLRRYYRLTCQWRFKSAQCGYVGGTASCNHDAASCVALGNLVRLGCFPGTGSAIRRIYV